MGGKIHQMLSAAISELQVIFQVSYNKHIITLIIGWEEEVKEKGKTLLLCAKENVTFGRHSTTWMNFSKTVEADQKEKISAVVKTHLIPINSPTKAVSCPKLVGFQ